MAAPDRTGQRSGVPTGVDLEVPFLIVGAGPVGLTAARLLTQRGHRCLVVERRDGPRRHPAAHVVNARTLEIFRQAELDLDAIDAVAQDPADAGHVNYVTRLGGELIGRLPFERQGDECLADTPTPLRNISQHHLEPLLAEAVAAEPLSDLRYRTEWRSSEQDDDGVTSAIATVHDEGDEGGDGNAEADGETFRVRSRWVLAADGAGSRVRAACGIDMVGPPALQSFIAIHLGGDLRPVIGEHTGVLHFVMDPAVTGTFIAHDLASEWVLMVGFDPTTETVDDYRPERCRRIVDDAIESTALGRLPDDAIEIRGVGSWHMSAQVADRLRADRVFLVGDAAHRFPPTGGLGLNTGVADAHNLAWKLDAIERGWGDATLLDTYQIERHPVAGLNCEQSTTNAFKIVSLIEALGLRDGQTTERLLATLADPANRPAIDAAVADQRPHFDMLGLQLGHVYAAGAIDPDHDDEPPTMDDPSHFDPHGEVGGRLPHGWTGDGGSTLDLIRTGGLTLLTVGDDEGWGEAVAGALAVTPAAVPVRHVRLGVDATVADDWLVRCRLETGGALLVRPDQHIAWRADRWGRRSPRARPRWPEPSPAWSTSGRRRRRPRPPSEWRSRRRRAHHPPSRWSGAGRPAAPAPSGPCRAWRRARRSAHRPASVGRTRSPGRDRNRGRAAGVGPRGPRRPRPRRSARACARGGCCTRRWPSPRGARGRRRTRGRS